MSMLLAPLTPLLAATMVAGVDIEAQTIDVALDIAEHEAYVDLHDRRLRLGRAAVPNQHQRGH
jgi:hypothetical protein